MSPKSRGRPAGRGKPKTRRQPSGRSPRLSDLLVRSAGDLLKDADPLEVEQWASGWLGQVWWAAPLDDRQPEQTFCLEVATRSITHPSVHGLAALEALRRVAPPSEHALLDETIDLLRQSH